MAILTEAVGSIGNFIVEQFKFCFSVVNDYLGNIIVPLIRSVVDTTFSITGTLIDWFSPAFEVFNHILDGVKDMISFCAHVVTDVLGGIKDIIISLFVPNPEYMSGIKAKFDDKFPIIGQVSGLVVDFGQYITGSKAPNWTITWQGVTCKIVDWTAFDMVRTFIHAIIIALAYFRFGQWLLRYVPTLIRGL